ncbi:hypothetical protein C8A00DRAFT_45943 [Chaetomidium leptoderma]|uniref:F-box domain-containing protein n=1 Tax=Chaetomidium leptoderma TaxID=669021 RepID=A0AAN6ZUH1_9PEZI|nr:hypothetical protein C8A00DRAFT_45943 [Chaetomidium leptoderma]
MPDLDEEPETILRLVACRVAPRFTEPMLSADKPPRRPEPAALAGRTSSLGSLDCFPSEIQSVVLGMLDIQAVGRVARVSFQGNLLVRSHPQYRDLKEFVPGALEVLAVFGMASLHSIRELHAAMRSDRCDTCPTFGPFLFLPTGKRCCMECLRLSRVYRMVFVEYAKKVFGLSDLHLQQLPTISVPPRNKYWQRNTRFEGRRLVSGNAARDLAATLGLPIEGEWGAPEFFEEAEKPGMFYGMASIAFPSVSKTGVVEEAFWCYGCEFVCDDYRRGIFPRDAIEKLAAIYYPGARPTKRPDTALDLQARPKTLFLEHAQDCYGSRRLLDNAPWRERRECL